MGFWTSPVPRVEFFFLVFPFFLSQILVCPIHAIKTLQMSCTGSPASTMTETSQLHLLVTMAEQFCVSMTLETLRCHKPYAVIFFFREKAVGSGLSSQGH